MSELVALYLTSVFLIGALALLGRQNRRSGWRKRRAFADDLLEAALQTPQRVRDAATMHPGALTSDANAVFSMQLAKLQSHLAQHGSVAPGPELPAPAEAEVPAAVRHVPKRLAL